jgi:uncharacterized 2Fe-2S/4Fe-4S cluster protein (DUF4445 family)
METVLVRLEPLGETVAAEAGSPLRDILFAYGVEFPCGGASNCKRCRVRIIEGELEDTVSAGILTPREFQEGWRLACCASVRGDVTLEVGQWESNILSDNSQFQFTPRSGKGLAIDLGTTTLVAQLVDLETASVLGVRTALNPQARHGADVMTRVQYALQPEGRDELRQLIRDELDRMIAELTLGRKLPSQIAIVGNTAMHHLYCGFSVEPLSHAPFEPVEMQGAYGFLPNLGGFVGSDILAGILATGVYQSEDLVALIDLGTNGEIVLGNRDLLLCASTAVGPAFEGGRISSGMRAATGAISAVEVTEGGIECRVLGNVRARGLCGSGLVDAIACGLETRAIQPNGRMPRPFPLIDGIAVTQKDVREVQLAKGAIAGGIRVLLRRLAAKAEDVSRVYLAGAFGNYINVRSARRIGLLEFPESVIQPAGNTALAGAKRALFEEDRDFTAIRARVAHVPLGADEQFQEEYADAMRFPG